MVKAGVVGIVMIIVACIGWSGIPSEASGAAGTKTPESSKGKRIFSRHCAGCHGPEGKGDGYKLLGADPANLTAPATRKKSDSALLTTIHEGKPNMPSWKGLLSDRDIQSVLAYIRTLPH
ncbi:MAG: c-type cytochrome [Nitrospira sp.]|jgi:mono/diheme cytochrome c family protein|nr:c-type cytochrome [Nitrospira sp.]MDR4474682.1 c-type cytochrome [Nitrospira sp.]